MFEAGLDLAFPLDSKFSPGINFPSISPPAPIGKKFTSIVTCISDYMDMAHW